MKIVHCFFLFEMGGAQVLAVDMLNEMAKKHDVSLIIINNNWNEALLQRLNNNISVYFMRRQEGSRNPLPILEFNLLLNKLKPDVIHCHERKIVSLIKYGSYNTLYTIHDVGVPTDTFKRYKSLVAISQSVADDVKDRSGLATKVITNGVSINKFKQRDDYTISNGTPIRLVQISRLVHNKKGQDILIKAVAQLINQHSLPVTVDFVGPGPSKDYLLSLAQSLGVAANINFLGERDREWVYNNLADYHILIQPSRFEGFGLTVVEGLAAGLPVVASNIEGPAEIIEGLPAGFLFESENADACAQLINKVVNLYQSEQIGESIARSREAINRTYSMERTAENYLDLYTQLSAQFVDYNQPVDTFQS